MKERQVQKAGRVRTGCWLGNPSSSTRVVMIAIIVVITVIETH